MTAATSSSTDRATQYASDVVSGQIVAGPSVRAACKRHLQDLERDGIFFDLNAANHAIDFFEEVLHLNGGEHEGMPFKLLPWQAFVVGSLFGWKGEDGYRRFRMAFIETGKGSGKSPLAAGVGLYMMTADKEPRAEIYAAATKRDQAKVLFRDAVAMVEQSPKLKERLTLSGGTEKHNIAYLKSGSFFRPISTENQGKGQSGPRPHCALLDEIHEHPTNAMVEFMRAGTKGRRQALIFMITNSGSDRLSVCYDYHEYGVKVANGDLEDDTFFSFVCDLDEKDDPLKDESCWPKANPSLGATFPLKYLREQVHQAKWMLSKQNLVLRLNFCVWTDSSSAWISREAWESIECDLDPESFKGRSVYSGLDLSSKLDLTALAFAVKQADDTIDAWVEFWTPEETLIERERKDRAPYGLWVKSGHLNTAPGKSIDYSFVVKRLAEIDGLYRHEYMAFDRWRIEDFQRELLDEGVFVESFPHGQGYKDMSPAIDQIESLIISGKLRVKRNPVLRWNVSSVLLEQDQAGNRKFNKIKSTARIDGIVALTMAITACMKYAGEEYVTGGLVTL